MPGVLQVHQVNLLRWISLCLGRRSRLSRSLPALHLLSCHGYCSFQSLSSVVGPCALKKVLVARKHQGMVDSPNRDHLHGLLLVPLRILPGVVRSSDLDHPCLIRARLAHCADAPSHPNQPVSLGYADFGSW